MSVTDLILTLFEVGLIAFVLWALFHEDIVADFEKRLFKKIKPCFKAVKNWIIGG